MIVKNACVIVFSWYNFVVINLKKEYTISVGFFASSSNYPNSIARCLSRPATDNTSGELYEMEVALQTALEVGIPVRQVFIINQTVIESLFYFILFF